MRFWPLAVGLLFAAPVATLNAQQRRPLTIEPIDAASPFQLSLSMTVVPIAGGLLLYGADRDPTARFIGVTVAAFGLIDGPSMGYVFGLPRREVRGVASALARTVLSLQVGDIIRSSRLRHTAVPYVVGALVPASAVYDIGSLGSDDGHNAKFRLSPTLGLRTRQAGLAVTVTP